MKLFLVRNAETLWNQERRLHGNQDSPLTENGKKQSQTLADLLEDEPIDIVYSSDLGRAIDTAKAIVSKHPEVKILNCRELRERSHGIAEGLTQKQVFDEYPKLQQERLKNKFLFKNPKGESYLDAQERLKPFVEELRQKHFSHNVLIVSHAGISRILIGLFLNLSPEEIMSIDQPHETVYVIENADSNPIVKRLTPEGPQSDLLTREHLQKPSFAEEESESVALEDDWV